jgi:hypothetical protein
MIIKLMKIVEKRTIEMKVAMIDQIAIAVGDETLKWLVSPMLAMAKIITISTARDTAITNPVSLTQRLPLVRNELSQE